MVDVWTILPATAILGFILRNKKGANLSEVYHLFQPLVVDLDQQSVSNGMGKITCRQLNPVLPNTTTL